LGGSSAYWRDRVGLEIRLSSGLVWDVSSSYGRRARESIGH